MKENQAERPVFRDEDYSTEEVIVLKSPEDYNYAKAFQEEVEGIRLIKKEKGPNETLKNEWKALWVSIRKRYNLHPEFAYSLTKKPSEPIYRLIRSARKKMGCPYEDITLSGQVLEEIKPVLEEAKRFKKWFGRESSANPPFGLSYEEEVNRLRDEIGEKFETILGKYYAEEMKWEFSIDLEKGRIIFYRYDLQI